MAQQLQSAPAISLSTWCQQFYYAEMKRVSYRILALVAIAILGAETNPCRSHDGESPEKLDGVLEQPIHVNLGIFKPQSRHEIRVPFFNPTDRPLYVYGYSKSCTCASLSFEEEIPPKKSVMTTVSLKAPKTPGEHDANFSIYTVHARTARTAEYKDEFLLDFSVREDCTFVPAIPVLTTGLDLTGNSTNTNNTIRVVNYSGKKWHKPTVTFTPAIPFSSEEATEMIDGAVRQVFLLSIDRRKLAQTDIEFPPGGHSRIGKLTAYRRFPNGGGTMAVIGETEFRIREVKNLEVRPTMIAFDPSHPRDVTFIVVCRVPGMAITKDKILVSVSAAPLSSGQFDFVQMSEQWGKVTIRSDLLQGADKRRPMITFEIAEIGAKSVAGIRFVSEN
jgi:hypothetical protein